MTVSARLEQRRVGGGGGGLHRVTDLNVLHSPNEPPNMPSCFKIEQACVNRRALMGA